MSQIGMQMPGSRTSRRPTPDVYTALMFTAVVALIAASVIVWIQGAKISPTHPLSVQSGNSVQFSD